MKMLHYIVGPIATNCYVLVSDDDQGLVIDPGASGDRIGEELVKSGVTPLAILLTHGHFDHVDGVSDLVSFFKKRNTDISVYILRDEMETLKDPMINRSGMMGRGNKDYSSLISDTFEADEKKTIAGFTFQVIPTPGHTPGGCSYYFPEQKMLFPGDTLFYMSAGRTDFEGSSTAAIIHSIQERLLTLPEDTSVFPGHGEATNIGFERVNNPYSNYLS